MFETMGYERVWFTKRTFKRTKCDKCDKKCIYVLAYCKPFVCLCVDHAPRMSNGDPGYTELHIVTEPPYGWNQKQYVPATKGPEDRCYKCEKKIKNIKNFTFHTLRNAPINSVGYYKPAVPVVEFEYWLCKKGCYDETTI